MSLIEVIPPILGSNLRKSDQLVCGHLYEVHTSEGTGLPHKTPHTSRYAIAIDSDTVFHTGDDDCVIAVTLGGMCLFKSTKLLFKPTSGTLDIKE